MRLRYRVDGRARLIGAAGQIEQAPDVFDLEPEIAGMPDEQQPALQTLARSDAARQRFEAALA